MAEHKFTNLAAVLLLPLFVVSGCDSRSLSKGDSYHECVLLNMSKARTNAMFRSVMRACEAWHRKGRE